MKRRNLINRITKIGILSALSVILYYISFPLPFFPPFLKVNFSMIAIILVGLMYGPIDAMIVVIIRCVLKLPFSNTAYVGEFADLIIGILTIVPGALIYKLNRSKKGGIVSLFVIFIMWVITGTLSNLVTIPLYVKALGLDKIIGALASVIPSVTKENYLVKYMLFGALPFNILVSLVVSLVTFFVYKHISKIFKKDFLKPKGDIK